MRYEVIDHHGVTQTITGAGILVEDLPCRLIPPQRVMPSNEQGHFRINGQEAKFIFASNSGEVHTPFSPSGNLPTVALFRNVEESTKMVVTSMHSCVTKQNNQNLAPTAKETL